jgi:hypothetical protein
VKHGVNGWIVPCGDSQVVSQLLYDIYTGKSSLPSGPGNEAASQQMHADPISEPDPNTAAQTFVRDLKAPVRPIHDPVEPGSTSEDFWTVGNAVKWMLLASRVLGLGLDEQRESVHSGDGDGDGAEHGEREQKQKQDAKQLGKLDLEDVEVLKRMGVGEDMWRGVQVHGKGAENVWKMVMGDDLGEGEGEVRSHQ